MTTKHEWDAECRRLARRLKFIRTYAGPHIASDDQNDMMEAAVRLVECAEAMKTAPTQDARDAARWRKFNEVCKKQFNQDYGRMEFYLPRSGAGFKGLEETLDEYLDQAQR